ncbi:zinc transporter foi-like isoform X2 [Watersipora subatra]|uniref:zinc transporter foi-like isoform X2 n=1 Tax=Watersipora subatra TaxID=2589382 RepID=UPI00355C2854
MMYWLKFFTLCVLCTGGAALQSSNYSSTELNMCILEHMLLTYTDSDNLTLTNIAKLFDTITTGYHDKAPAHSPRATTGGEDEDDNIKTSHKHRSTREIHMAGVAGVQDNLKYSGQEICSHYPEEMLHECLPGSVVLERRGYMNGMDGKLTQEVFESLCPSLLFQLTMTPCIYHPHTFLVEKPTNHPVSATNTKPYLAWVGAVAAVLVISLCGLAIISFIPLIKKSFYQQAIQFLVALAVGTLVGDALLHLLPHALSEHEEAETDLRSSRYHVWRATIALLGIYVFFNAERLLGIITSIKRDRKKLQANRRETIESEDDIKSIASCGSCAAVPYLTGHTSHEISARSKSLNEIREMANEAHQNLHVSTRTPCRNSTDLVNVAGHHSEVPPRTKSCHFPCIPENTASPKHLSMPMLNQVIEKPVTNSKQMTAGEATVPLIQCGSPSSANKLLAEVSTVSPSKSVDSGSTEEGHGHSHSVPNSWSSVAYMVVMGDGLHNFTDGLAIGAAFASSFSGGMSTSLAVLCHELPHELGDFAMLLKTGMSMKQAYMCNLMSASLQCLGVIIGVLIGNVTSATQWLFAFAGGIFLYVGLVDMLPEITKIDNKRPWKQLLLQNFGLMCGFVFMLLIATFETDIENIFVPK